MAREAELVLKVVTEVAEARAAIEKLFRDVEAREIKLNVRTSGETGGSPATLGNPTGTGPTGAMAGDRLDALSVARSSGPSLAMQNGRPGAASGGIGVAAGDILQQQSVARHAGYVEGFASPESASFARSAMEGASARIGRMPRPTGEYGSVPVTALDRLGDSRTNAQMAAAAYAGTNEGTAYQRQADRAELAYNAALSSPSNPGLERQKSRALEQQFRENERTTGGYRDLFYRTRDDLNAQDAATDASYQAQKSRALTTQFNQSQSEQSRAARAQDTADFAQFRAQEREAERTASGGGTRYGGILSRLRDAGAALESSRGTPDERAYQGEYDELLGQQAIAQGLASPIGAGPRGERPESIRRQLSRYAATGFGIYAAGQTIQSINQFADIGQNPTGSTASLAIRNELASYQAFNGIAQGVPVAGPLLGGAMDFGSAIGNYTGGNGFVTEGTRLARATSLAESQSALARRNLTTPFDIRSSKTFNGLEKIGIAEGAANASDQFDLDQNAALRPEDRAKAMLDARRRNRLTADIGTRDYVYGISSGYANADVDQRSAQATLDRDAVGALREETFGRVKALPANTDTGTRQVAQYQANARYNAGINLIRRDNTEAAYDQGQNTLGGQQALSGFSLQGALTGVAARQTQQLREVGGTGIGFLDNLLGYTARRDAINGAAGLGRAEAYLADRRESISTRSFVNSTNYQLADNPVQAQLEESKGRFDQQRGDSLPGSPSYERAAAERNSRDALINRQSSNSAKLLGISQRYSGLALDRELARDPVGADAAGIAGDTITQGNQIIFAGAGGAEKAKEQAEEARRQGLKRLDLESQNYGLSFRGSEENLYDFAVGNPRDSADPSSVFAQITARRQDIASATFGSQSGDGSGAYNGPSRDDLMTMLQSAVKDIVAGIAGD